MEATYHKPLSKSHLFTHKALTGNSTDFTLPGDTDFREGFSIQLSRSREEASDPSRAMMRQIAGSFEQYGAAGP
jgi:hypothetical protein